MIFKKSKNEKKEYYSVFTDEGIREYYKDNLNDLNELVGLLIEEVEKANDKQKQWFKSYWEMKQKVNRVKDVVSDDET